MKKFVSVLLALVIAFSVILPVMATETEIGTDNEIVSEPAENGAVATISLCTSVYVWPISGHTWIYVHNISDEPIQVGHYTVPVGEGVSMGAFSFSVSDGWGIYYNVEAYKENTKNRMDRVWSKTESIDAGQLETLTNSLINYPNYWGVVGNCATFAFSIWNAVTGDFYFSLLIPAITQIMLMVSGAKRGNLEMFCPSRDNVYRLKGQGENARLERASDYTVS